MKKFKGFTIKLFASDYLRNAWANDKKITYESKKYRVGKMSYGDYFLEPGPQGRETDNFNRGTLWLKKQNRKPFYQIDFKVSR